MTQTLALRRYHYRYPLHPLNNPLPHMPAMLKVEHHRHEVETL
ncbi:MAG TPA: hypothetical protein V6D37_13035 [Candidatus Sericytochromatia bacterium]